MYVSFFLTSDTGYIYPSNTDCVIARDHTFSPHYVPETYAPLSTYTEPGSPILLIPQFLSFYIDVFISTSLSLLLFISLSLSISISLSFPLSLFSSIFLSLFLSLSFLLYLSTCLPSLSFLAFFLSLSLGRFLLVYSFRLTHYITPELLLIFILSNICTNSIDLIKL